MHQIVDEDRRVQELFRYYVPDDTQQDASCAPVTSASLSEQVHVPANASFDQITSPKTHYNALCQLAAIRLGVQRIGISLIGHRQYILAEATRTLDLADSTKCDDEGDTLVFGFMECDRMGNLCENTVDLLPQGDDDIPPCFMIPDLSKDHRFAEAPYVKSGPRMRFYCGTPITTKKKLNIGSFWALDDRTLPEFAPAQKRFFGTMAALVMDQLESARERGERQRALRMGTALSYFVDGKLSLGNLNTREREQQMEATPTTFGDSVPPSPKRGMGEKSRPAPTVVKTGDFDKDDQVMSSNADLASPLIGISRKLSLEDVDGEALNMTFARATYLMREAFEAQGCVIFDAAVDFSSGTDKGSDTESARTSSNGGSDFHLPDEEHSNQELRPVRPGVVRLVSQSSMSNESHRQAQVLGFAVKDRASLHGDRPDSTKDFSPIDEKFLTHLTRRYPDGAMWSFGESGFISSSDEDGALFLRRGSLAEPRKKPTESEARRLQRYFPGVQQILFCPIFDSNLGTFTSGCFAFTTNSHTVLEKQIELTYMKSFSNNIAAEVSRISSIASDISKTNFIGSISHELRSPLHGICVASEFLQDTSLNSFQKSLVNTQVSCSRTLLEVIEHVLEFAKINNLKKEERVARRHRRAPGVPDTADTRTHTMQMQTDVAELIEEVVEGAVAGKSHTWNDVDTPLEPTQPDKGNGKILNRNTTNGTVDVILDLDFQDDWAFVTQPGALRRIVLNVLGNSLKYCVSGFIKIRLRVQKSSAGKSNSTPTISLVISDTGRGMSRDFLRYKLFTAFAQEDHLSVGCGLGLSMVRSLVESLKGSIEVVSEKNVGTTVSINLPVAHALTNGELPKHTPSSFSQKFFDLAIGNMVAYVGFELPAEANPNSFSLNERTAKYNMYQSVSAYMERWLKMKSTKSIEDADYVIVLIDELLADFIRPYMENLEKKQPRVIAVLEHEMPRKDAERALGQTFRSFEVISTPVGPRKLARAVAACEKAARNYPAEHGGPILKKIPERGGPDLAPKNLLEDGDINGDTPELEDELNTLTRQATPPTLRTSSFPTSLIRFPILTNRDPRDFVLTNSPKTPLKSSVEHGSINNTIHRAPRHTPHLLLVDDNKINLRLLETYIRKRSCTYETAENGLLAFQAFEKCEQGFDILFLDLSMPVMGGMEAARRIRRLERERTALVDNYEKDGDGDSDLGNSRDHEKTKTKRSNSSLIVALTGLANSRDQAQAFASGIDLYLTKPVKFKEIGKLIDHWEEHGNADAILGTSGLDA